ncbi:MAG: thymidylate synthase [Desulfobacterota bacterium]|nr:thymidylate synthase [Thermodesulfobacteriota bacterium]
MKSKGDIPILFVEADCLPEAWEKTVLKVWDEGLEIRTQYDRAEDPPSKDATVIVTIRDPFSEPRIHKNFPGGPVELEIYRQEVVEGIHDHWIDPEAGKWTYTYHERLFAYCPVQDLKAPKDPVKPFSPVDQIEYIVEALSKAPYSRRAQAITWMPTADIHTDDPPCLQRIWCRLAEDETGRLVLNMNAHWRSRDLYKAWFMNVYALTDLQRVIAERISERIGGPVGIGRYVDISDSLHLYGRYFEEISAEVEKMRDGQFRNRSWDSTHPAFALMVEEARAKLARDPDWYAKGKK